MYIVYVHDAKIVKENGLTLQFCSNYPSKMSRFDAMYIFLTNYNTILQQLLKLRLLLQQLARKIQILLLQKQLRWEYMEMSMEMAL